MSETHSYTGACVCKRVQYAIEFEEKPLFSVFCHCADCREIHSSAFSCYVGVDPDRGLKVLQGEEELGSFCIEKSTRYFCSHCGTLAFTRVDVEATGTRFVAAEWSLLEPKDARIEPQIHIRYRSRIMAVPDGKPKFSGPPGTPLLDDWGQPLDGAPG